MPSTSWGPWAHIRIDFDTHPGTDTCHVLVVGTRWRGSTPDRRVLLRAVAPDPLDARAPIGALMQATQVLLLAVTQRQPEHEVFE